MRRWGERPGPASESLPRRKPRGGRGRLVGAAMGISGSRTADERGVGDRRRSESSAEAPTVGIFGREDGRVRALTCGRRRICATWRGHRACAPARGWKGKRSTLRGEMRGDGHEVSILIRVGDGDRAGRAPSNVSMMIIRPPQHGHRRAVGGLRSRCRPRRARSGRGCVAAASNWRTRSMLCARTAPAMRP